MINNHKTEESKIQLKMYIYFISSKDTGETRTTYVWSDNEEIRWGSKTDDTINKRLKSLSDNYQKEEQIVWGASDFNFESVELWQYSFHKIKLKRGGSYIKSPESIRNKLATISPKNEDDNNCFQYAVTIAINHQNIGDHPEVISNIKPFINQYNWEGINFPAHQNGQGEGEKPKNIMAIDWNKFGKNNKTIALNILYVPHNKKVGVAFKSKYNRKRESQVVLLLITNDEKYHYLALKSIPTADGYCRPVWSFSRLCRGIT